MARAALRAIVAGMIFSTASASGQTVRPPGFALPPLAAVNPLTPANEPVIEGRASHQIGLDVDIWPAAGFVDAQLS
ncbi:MAG TPA: hypothetical protein VGC51_13340 [Hansschlegelia sp.]